MKPVRVIKGTAAPLFEANIDTDVIIPSREMKQVSKIGLKNGLFAGRRYLDFDTREPDPDFVLNKPEYQNANILLADENFGCGSSREHAVWALLEYGIEAVIAPSFSPIFYKNCCNNGVLPIILDHSAVVGLVEAEDKELTIDLQAQLVTGTDTIGHSFSIEEGYKNALLNGLDPIDQTLQRSSEISAFADERKRLHPWAAL